MADEVLVFNALNWWLRCWEKTHLNLSLTKLYLLLTSSTCHRLSQQVSNTPTESFELAATKLRRPMPALMETWTSPKFITCPDCGDRYDHAKKRRLIDTCGHPRCYACLFVDNPCPLCLSKYIPVLLYFSKPFACLSCLPSSIVTTAMNSGIQSQS